MTFSNPIVAGQNLVIPGIQSPNYTAGVSGWRIARDGTVEFNSGVFRGSIQIGTSPGQHAILANPATGDPIDVYNASNQLDFSVDANGIMSSIDPTNNIDAQIQSAGLAFHVPRGTLAGGAGAGASGVVGTTRQDTVFVFANGHGTGKSSTLTLTAGSDDGTTSPATTELVERDKTVSPLVTLDLQTNNFVHVGAYNVTTDASGTGIITHNAGFTPKAGFLMGVNGIGANFPYQAAWFTSPFTSSTAKAAFKDNTGAALASTTLGVFGLFFG